MTTITYRPGTINDSYTVFCLFEESFADLSRRMGSGRPDSWDNPADLARFGLEVPIINRPAVDHLLARDYRLDTFVAMWMGNTPFGRFDPYIFTSPPFTL